MQLEDVQLNWRLHHLPALRLCNLGNSFCRRKLKKSWTRFRLKCQARHKSVLYYAPSKFPILSSYSIRFQTTALRSLSREFLFSFSFFFNKVTMTGTDTFSNFDPVLVITALNKLTNYAYLVWYLPKVSTFEITRYYRYHNKTKIIFLPFNLL